MERRESPLGNAPSVGEPLYRAQDLTGCFHKEDKTMGTPYIEEIRMFGGSFAPAGWAFCNGQLLAISQNAVLFNLIGRTYGGDGQNTFALPDLQSRIPMHAGNGHVLDEEGRVETVTPTTSQIPAHSMSRRPIPERAHRALPVEMCGRARPVSHTRPARRAPPWTRPL